MTPDLSEDETRALTDPLKHALNDDRCPLSPRIQMRRAIPSEAGSRPPSRRRTPYPAPKHFAPPRAGLARRRRGAR